MIFTQLVQSAYRVFSQVEVNEDLGPPTTHLTDDTWEIALQITFGVAAGIAVIMMAIAAFQYVVSTGNPQATAKAKDTIIYSLVGLVVSLMAFTIVTFVLGRM